MTATATLTLLQFNVLVDLDAPGCIDDWMREYADAADLEWPARCSSIADKVRAADCAFLEEVTPTMFAGLKDALPEYGGWHAADFVEAEHAAEQEIALFVRRETAIVVGEPRVRRLVTLARTEAERDLLMEPCDYCSAAAFAVFTATVRQAGWPADDCVVVGGAHLRAEFGDTPAARSKALQGLCAGRALIEHALEVGAEVAVKGVALAGDFNSWPSHGACLALKGCLPVGHPEHPGGACTDLALPITPGGLTPLRSAHAERHGAEPRFTRKKNSLRSQFCLDYILFGGEALRVVGCDFGPGAPPCAADGDGSDLKHLPCAAWPSDHLPLFAELQIS